MTKPLIFSLKLVQLIEYSKNGANVMISKQFIQFTLIALIINLILTKSLSGYLAYSPSE